MNKGLPWHVVEKAIHEEEKWILEVFDFGIRDDREEDYMRNLPGLSKEKILRQIGISIVRGRIKARDFETPGVNQLWIENSKGWEVGAKGERHGGEWHRDMMHVVRKHFEESSFEVISEPFLNFGRADLGVYKEGVPDLYVEIGTTSLFKTWLNLHSMPNSVFLFVPTVYRAVELRT